MAAALRALAWVMGVACALIGVYHFAGGIGSVPGTDEVLGAARATVDSRERFYSAIFIAYGLAWVWVARQRPIPANAVRALAAVFLLGGVGRCLSLAMEGWPHWFQVPEAVVELVLPFVFFWLARADEKDEPRSRSTTG